MDESAANIFLIFTAVNQFNDLFSKYYSSKEMNVSHRLCPYQIIRVNLISKLRGIVLDLRSSQRCL
jgi:hypothetical protein